MESRECKGTYIQEYGLMLLLQQRSSSALGQIIVLPEDVTEDIISFFHILLCNGISVQSAARKHNMGLGATKKEMNSFFWKQSDFSSDQV